MLPKDLIEPDALQKQLENINYVYFLEDNKNKNIVQQAKDSQGAKNETSLPQKVNETMETSQVELLQQQPGITTSSKRLDQLFGPINGIPTKSVIEFSGTPGCGKTQLCMTLALNVQLPIGKGGLDGHCIYIDTEGGLMIERFYQMTEKNYDYELVQQKLRNIVHYRVLDYMELIALVRQLPDILQKSPKVKLLIVDSVAYHLRLNIRQYRTRAGFTDFLGQSLAQMASQFDLAVVVTSHVSRDVKFGKSRPALGDIWGQWCTKRLMLTRKRQQRYLSIYDPSRRTPVIMEPFTITENGIEDVDKETLARTNQWQESEMKKDVTSPNKMRHQGSGFSTWSATYDSKDIWNEQGGFTDEFLSEIPLALSSTVDAMDEDGEENKGNCATMPDPQRNMQQQMEYHDDSTSITASDVPPTAVPYLSQTIRRKQLPQSQDSTTIFNNNNKRARCDEYASTNPSPMKNVRDDDQGGDDWGSESDELWLAIADSSSPFSLM